MHRLDWDSDFWGFDIYKIDKTDNLFEQDLIANITNRSNSFLIQALVSSDEVQTINCLEEKGFRFIESKITMKKMLDKTSKINKIKFKEIKKHELDSQRYSFFDLYGKISRFSLFRQEKINDFYYFWVIKSIDGKLDDKCIGYYIDDQLAGFITYRYDNIRVSIGLVGVFPEFHQKGVSQKLLDYVNNKAIKKGYSEIIISTQGKNISAINAYIKNGFIFKNIKHWYYLKGDKLG